MNAITLPYQKKSSSKFCTTMNSHEISQIEKWAKRIVWLLAFAIILLLALTGLISVQLWQWQNHMTRVMTLDQRCGSDETSTEDTSPKNAQRHQMVR